MRRRRYPLFSIVIGRRRLGFGMALVGTCGMGSLVRLGTAICAV